MAEEKCDEVGEHEPRSMSAASPPGHAPCRASRGNQSRPHFPSPLCRWWSPRHDRGLPMRILSPRSVACAVVAALFLVGCGKKKDEPTYGDGLARAVREGKAMQARSDLQTISLAVTSFLTNEGNLPEATDMAELAGKLEPAYTRRLPRTDPWGTEYTYSQDGSSYTLMAAGKDMAFGTEDDMVLVNGQITKMPKSYENFQEGTK